MKKLDVSRLLRNALYVFGGSVIYGVAIACLLDPNNIAPGGISGLAIILSEYLPLDTGLLTILMNVPLLIAGLIRFKGEFFFGTIIGTVFSSMVTDFIAKALPAAVPVTHDMMLAAVAGGGLCALGSGIVLLGGGSTGGTDIIIKFLRQKYVHLKTGTMSMAMDFFVALLSCIVFGNVEAGLYAVVSMLTGSIVVDFVIYGGNEAKLVYVISDRTEAISNRLMEELGHGVTWLEARGAYTGSEKKVIFSAFRKHNYQKVREIVKDEDPAAFLIVTSASEIFGEGFKDHFADEI